MLALIFILLVVFITLAIVLWAGTLFTQGYIYSEPEANLYWRAPLAAGALTAFFGFWCVMNLLAASGDTYQAPYAALFHFSPVETKVVERLWSVRGEDEILYTAVRTDEGRVEYVNTQGEPWRREDANGLVEAILIEEGGSKVRFEPELVHGKFPPTAESFPGYREKGGRRVMEQLGQVSTFRWGSFLVNLFLNCAHLGLWFGCLWLVLRFQWPHALAGAVIIWLIMTLVVLPMLLERSLEAGRQRAGRVAYVLPLEPVHDARGLAQAPVVGSSRQAAVVC